MLSVDMKSIELNLYRVILSASNMDSLGDYYVIFFLALAIYEEKINRCISRQWLLVFLLQLNTVCNSVCRATE